MNNNNTPIIIPTTLNEVNLTIPIYSEEEFLSPYARANVDIVLTHDVAQPAEVENGAAQQPGGFFGGGFTGMIIIYLLFFGVLYLLFIRPQKKRQKKMQELQDSIRVGDNVLLSGGMFGKITDIGDDVYMVELGTNKSVLIPFLKGEVIDKREPKLR